MVSRHSLCGAATQKAWQRQIKKPRHANMSRRNSCPNSFLLPAWWQLSRLALARSILAKPKPSMPSRSRHRFMSSLSRPRNTDFQRNNRCPKRGVSLASVPHITTALRTLFVPGFFAVSKSLWPSAVLSSRLRARGCCRALVLHAPGGICPVDRHDRRCACRNLLSLLPLGQPLFWARARSTAPHQSQFRPQFMSSLSRLRNTDLNQITAPALRAPVAHLPLSTLKGATC